MKKFAILAMLLSLGMIGCSKPATDAPATNGTDAPAAAPSDAPADAPVDAPADAPAP